MSVRVTREVVAGGSAGLTGLGPARASSGPCCPSAQAWRLRRDPSRASLRAGGWAGGPGLPRLCLAGVVCRGHWGVAPFSVGFGLAFSGLPVVAHAGRESSRAACEREPSSGSGCVCAGAGWAGRYPPEGPGTGHSADPSVCDHCGRVIPCASHGTRSAGSRWAAGSPHSGQAMAAACGSPCGCGWWPGWPSWPAWVAGSCLAGGPGVGVGWSCQRSASYPVLCQNSLTVAELGSCTR
jgi:hypothetical protein